VLPIRRVPRQEASDVTTGVDSSRIDADERPEEPSTRAVRVETTLYESARLIADLRGESVESVVARALRVYAQGRRRPRD
jgi:hypothetical protein